MAKDVKFNIRIKVDGKDVVVQARTDVQKLGTALGTIPGKAEKVRRSFISMAAVSQTFGNLRDGISSLSATMSTFFEAARESALRETQLTTVMQQRMNATEADVESIKKLTAAQQQLGIIEDDAQIAGAQQIATFVTQKSSLEALIPAMNNLLAQQKGYNATGQDAVTVGNLIGKVMQGQVSALTRVGVTFTEAQKKVLQYGTESERAAMLAQVITDNVGNMNQALAQTDYGKITQAANAFGDMQEEIGMALAPLEPLLQKLGEIGFAVSGVVQISAAFGTLAKALGVTTLAHNTLNAARSYGSKVAQQAGYFSKQLGAYMAFEGKSALAAAVSTDVFKTAIRGLMIATGVGAAIVALSYGIEALINYFEKASDSSDDVTASFNRQKTEADALATVQSQLSDKVSDSTAKQKTMIEQLNATIHDSTKSYDERRQAIEDLQAIVPDYHASITQEGKLFRDNTTAITEYINKLDAAAEAEAAYSMMVDIKKQKLQIETQNQQDQEKINNTNRNFKNRTGFDLNDKYHYEHAFLVNSKGRSVNGDVQEAMGTARGWERNWRNNIAKRNQQLVGLNAQERFLQQKIDNRPEGVTIQDLANGTAFQRPKTNRQRTPVTPTRSSGTRSTSTTKTNETPKVEVEVEPVGIIGKLRKSLQDAEKELDGATTISAIVTARGKISDIQKQIDELTNGSSEASRPTIEADVEPTAFEKGSITDKRQSYQNASAKGAQIQSDYETGIIDLSEAQKQIDDINKQLRSLDKDIKPIKLNVDTSDLDRAKEKEQAATDAINQMGASLSSFGDTIGVPALNIAGTLAQAIATMVMGYATATAQAAKMGPWAWVAFAATGLAQLTAIIASVKGMAGSYATGGIVGGSSYSGDKLTAHVNSGEMILNRQQQTRLFAMANGYLPQRTAPTIRMNAAPQRQQLTLNLVLDGKTKGRSTALTLKNVRISDKKIGKEWL